MVVSELSSSQKETVKKWISALRSGEYKQGKFLLKRINEDGSCQYCCLGVLAETVGMTFSDFEGACSIVSSTKTQNVHTIDKFTCEEFDLSWLYSAHAENPYYVLISKLIIMNDDDSATFEEIADFLEQYFSNDESSGDDNDTT